MWERSYVAISVLLGATVEESMASLGDPAPAAGIAAKLANPRRQARAQLLALVAAEVNVALDEGALR